MKLKREEFVKCLECNKDLFELTEYEEIGEISFTFNPTENTTILEISYEHGFSTESSEQEFLCQCNHCKKVGRFTVSAGQMGSISKFE